MMLTMFGQPSLTNLTTSRPRPCHGAAPHRRYQHYQHWDALDDSTGSVLRLYDAMCGISIKSWISNHKDSWSSYLNIQGSKGRLVNLQTYFLAALSVSTDIRQRHTWHECKPRKPPCSASRTIICHFVEISRTLRGYLISRGGSWPCCRSSELAWCGEDDALVHTATNSYHQWY